MGRTLRKKVNRPINPTLSKPRSNLCNQVIASSQASFFTISEKNQSFSISIERGNRIGLVWVSRARHRTILEAWIADFCRSGGNSSLLCKQEAIMDSSSTALLVRRGSDEFSILTEEMIIEIFARLPVKWLLRFKTLSKRWYSLILSPDFIAIHSTHTPINNTLPLLLESRDHSVTTTVSIRFGLLRKHLPFSGHLNNLEMVGCFNGVVCLSLSQRPQKYALWNPATRQIRLFGDAPMESAPNRLHLAYGNGVWYGSGFCFDPVANDFKVTQIKLTPSEGEMTSRVQVNVFSIATSSWTEKNKNVPYRIMLGGSNIIHGATCVNRYIHWHVSISNDLMVFEDMYILSYNMIDEVFKRIEMPTRPVYGKYRLTSYKGSLAVIVHTPTDVNCTEVDVWVMNNCGGSNQSWSKILTCKLSNKSVCVLGFFRKDDVDLILFYEVPDRTLYSHDPESGVAKRF